ncbi:MAG TPA: MFS transporter [Steroidobacteraceae bacterium]|jgi:SHS family lactate transporter-like MFS transporter|nr:MFS transporter [Steroidobacteraceae bacterium]
MQWTKSQKNVVLAAYLGWTLDAFDFFLMVFMFKDIATTFHVDVKQVAVAVLLTLAARPVGAFIFGRLADRFGRKPTLMWNILAFSILEAASGFAPSLWTFLALRMLFGIAMGGEWGIGSALTFETIPLRARGVVSGLLQAGYPSGYFVAAIASFFFYDALGWRYMFLLGIVPAVLVFFIRMGIDESPAFIEGRIKNQDRGLIKVIVREWKLAVYAIVLMTAFNFFSHGSQDAYPNLFLHVQHGFDTHAASTLAAIMNIGAILGGIGFGFMSERIGRRRAIIFAALLALPVIPFWTGAVGTTPLVLGIGAFLMQVSVQGAWGIIPVHLNELSPPEIRATFPGVVYQLGNLIASVNLSLQVMIAEAHGNNYGLAMGSVVGTVVVVIVLMVLWGPEHRGIAMADAQREPAPASA